MIRRFGEPVRNDKRYIVRAGAYAILPHKNHLLLTFQELPKPEIQLPGGGIDPGESAIAAVHREVMEETGWKIANPRKLGVYRRYTYMPEYDLWAEKVAHIFVATPVIKMGDPTEKFHQALFAVPSDAIEMLANEGDRHFVNTFIRCR